MSATSLTARHLGDVDQQVDFPEILLDADGVIRSLGSGSPGPYEDLLSPALLDIHTHGAAGHDVMEGTVEAFDRIETFLASRGVGHYLPTTVTAPVESTLRSLEALAGRIEAGSHRGMAQPVGIHLEGPFLSHTKRGVHPPSELQQPDIALFNRFQQAARGHIRLLTIAPEIPGALDLIAHASASDVIVSLGHTNATAAETLLGIEAGAQSATHTFNAMRPLDHREPGVLGTVLDEQSLYADLICDGIHVAPALVRLWLKAKGVHRSILITDSMAAAGMPDGRYHLGQMEVDVANGRCSANGVLAGSVLTLDRAILNLQQFTGLSLQAAIRLASVNPASLLGRPDLAKITVGQPASLARFSSDGHLRSALIGGKATIPDGL